MITREQMFEPMLAAFPFFMPEWEAYCSEWLDELGDMPIYPALSILANVLTDRLRSGQIEEFASIFKVVERWHCEGDEYVREAASLGLLEDIQNHDGYEAFEQWLLPESKKWWDKVRRFWNGELTALNAD